MAPRRLSAAAPATSFPPSSAASQPAAGKGAAAGQPHRIVRNPPLTLHRQVHRGDLALNALHRDDPDDDLWIPAAVGGIVLFVGGFAFWVGGIL